MWVCISICVCVWMDGSMYGWVGWGLSQNVMFLEKFPITWWELSVNSCWNFPRNANRWFCLLSRVYTQKFMLYLPRVRFWRVFGNTIPPFHALVQPSAWHCVSYPLNLGMGSWAGGVGVVNNDTQVRFWQRTSWDFQIPSACPRPAWIIFVFPAWAFPVFVMLACLKGKAEC